MPQAERSRGWSLGGKAGAGDSDKEPKGLGKLEAVLHTTVAN